ncbi:MAG: hypothetical protein QOI55_2752, partial [Actinomycetota bacterium]|nr:hypothetical protein [Actinomycetota bacterium]
MVLTTDGPFTTDSVEEICGLADDVYRNYWITYGYYRLSKGLQELIPGNATWCTFARWSSYTVGEWLRIDGPNRRLEQLLPDWLPETLKDAARQLQRDARLHSDQAMPRTLAVGNRWVFHEIGHTIAAFLEWYTPERTRADWDIYRATIEASDATGLFRPGDVEVLRDGVESYFGAIRAPSDDARAELVLRGNILIAEYEQWRLDPVLQIAMDPFAKELVDFRASNEKRIVPGEFPDVVLRRAGTRWALRHESALYQSVADWYSGFVTRWWMTMEMPVGPEHIEPVLVGRAVTSGDASPYSPELFRLDDRDLAKLVSIYDHRATEGSGGARNWNSYTERMQFIVELFRSHQRNARLFDDMELHERILDLDLRDESLDVLRGEADPDADRFVEAHCADVATPYRNARELVTHLIRAGTTDDTDLFTILERDRPVWVDDDELAAGQRFLEDRGIEIASALFTAALPLSYTAGRGARVLVTTAELASGNLNRRIAETGQLLADLMPEGGSPIETDTKSG